MRERVEANDLRVLDDLLNDLEEAHERDELWVSHDLAGRLRRYVGGIVQGMPIRDAMAVVFHTQRRYLASAAGHSVSAVALPSMEPNPTSITRNQFSIDDTAVDEAEALSLTERIRSATRRVCLLLLEAHDRRAWSALGYRTWDEYVRHEFGFSRSRSYELLDQGRVVVALKAASGMSGAPDISARAAGELKHRLPELLDTIRRRIRDPDEDGSPEQVVQEVVSKARVRAIVQLKSTRPLSDPVLATAGSTAEAGERSIDSTRLQASIDYLARMPDAEMVVCMVAADGDFGPQLHLALRWLNEFIREWGRWNPAARKPIDDAAGHTATTVGCVTARS